MLLTIYLMFVIKLQHNYCNRVKVLTLAVKLVLAKFIRISYMLPKPGRLLEAYDLMFGPNHILQFPTPE